MKYRHLLLLLLLLIGCINKPIEMDLPQIEVKANSKIYFDKTNIGTYLPEYVLVAITNHECYENSPITERIFMMEAVWNRVQDNYDYNGITLSDQLLAKKQFTGLFKYRTHTFSIDFENNKDKYLIELARKIIYEHKRIYPEKRIYYWAGTDDSDHAHGKWVKRKQLKTLIKTKNIFA